MRSSSHASAPAVPWTSKRMRTCGPTITRLASSEPTVPPSSSISAAAQSSFSTSTRSSVSTRLKWVPSPIGRRGRRGIIVAVRPLRRSIGPTRKCVMSTMCAIRSPSAPEPASARRKRHEAAASGRLA